MPALMFVIILRHSAIVNTKLAYFYYGSYNDLMKYNFTHNYTMGGYESKSDRVAFNLLYGVFGLFILAMVILIAWVIGAGISEVTNYDSWYEYTDFNGNTGKANRCYQSKGTLTCQIWPEEEGSGLHINRNSEYIVVKSYKRLRVPKS